MSHARRLIGPRNSASDSGPEVRRPAGLDYPSGSGAPVAAYAASAVGRPRARGVRSASWAFSDEAPGPGAAWRSPGPRRPNAGQGATRHIESLRLVATDLSAVASARLAALGRDGGRRHQPSPQGGLGDVDRLQLHPESPPPADELPRASSCGRSPYARCSPIARSSSSSTAPSCGRPRPARRYRSRVHRPASSCSVDSTGRAAPRAAGKRLPELRQAQPQAAGGGPGRDAGDLRDLAVRVALEVGELQRAALLVREGGEGPRRRRPTRAQRVLPGWIRARPQERSLVGVVDVDGGRRSRTRSIARLRTTVRARRAANRARHRTGRSSSTPPRMRRAPRPPLRAGRPTTRGPPRAPFRHGVVQLAERLRLAGADSLGQPGIGTASSVMPTPIW